MRAWTKSAETAALVEELIAADTAVLPQDQGERRCCVGRRRRWKGRCKLCRGGGGRERGSLDANGSGERELWKEGVGFEAEGSGKERTRLGSRRCPEL